MSLRNLQVGVDSVVNMAAMAMTFNVGFGVMVAMVVVNCRARGHLYYPRLHVANTMPEEHVQGQDVEQLQSREDDDEKLQDFLHAVGHVQVQEFQNLATAKFNHSYVLLLPLSRKQCLHRCLQQTYCEKHNSHVSNYLLITRINEE